MDQVEKNSDNLKGKFVHLSSSDAQTLVKSEDLCLIILKDLEQWLGKTNNSKIFLKTLRWSEILF